MTLRTLVFSGCSAFAVIMTLPAIADSAFSTDADILGIPLNTPAAFAKQTILKTFPGSVVNDVHAQFGTQEYSRDVVVGYAADITAIGQQNANSATLQKLNGQNASKSFLNRVMLQPGDLGQDEVRIAIDPNDGPHNVYAIERFTVFPKSQRPIMSTIATSLAQKYGPPSKTVKQWDGEMDYYWFTNGALISQAPFVHNCLQEATRYNATITVSDRFRNYDPSRDVTSGSFSSLMNQINTNLYFFSQDIRKCGTMLAVIVSPPADPSQKEYVNQLSENLIDFVAGDTRDKAYATKFWVDANNAGQKKLSQDSKIKPKF
jgi:hypothetical protein